MAGLISIALGVAIVALTLLDVLVTTLAVGRAGGPFGVRIATSAWRAMLLCHRRRCMHHLLRVGGYIIFIGVIGVWALLMWVGWMLIFWGAETAVVEAATRAPADFWGLTYFVGYTLVTLGIGDYTPHGAVWQVATPICSATGFFTLTLTITYLLNVVSAAVDKRRLAFYMVSMGDTVEDFLALHYDGKGYGHLSETLTEFAPHIAELGQRYLAYPALLYFHSTAPVTAVALRLAILDEALSIVELATPEECHPHPAPIRATRYIIEHSTEMMAANGVKPAGEAPPPYPLARLRARGLPVLEDARYYEGLAKLRERRRRLRGFVETDGWEWDDVLNAGE